MTLLAETPPPVLLEGVDDISTALVEGTHTVAESATGIGIPLEDLRTQDQCELERTRSRGVWVNAAAAVQRVKDLPLQLYVKASNMDNAAGRITEAMVLQRSVKSKIAGRVACQAMFAALPYVAGAIDLMSHRVFGFAPVSQAMSHALITPGGHATAPTEAYTTSYLEPNPTGHGGVLEQTGATPISSVLELPDSKPGEFVSTVFEHASPDHGDQILSQVTSDAVHDHDIRIVNEANGSWYPEATHAQTIDGIHIVAGDTNTKDILQILAKDSPDRISLASDAHSGDTGIDMGTPRGVDSIPTDLPNREGLMEISGGKFPVFYDTQHQLGYVQLTPGVYGPDGHNYITFDGTSPVIAQQLAEHGFSFQGSDSSYGLMQTGIDKIDLHLPPSVKLSLTNDSLHFRLKDGTDIDVSKVSLEKAHAIDASGNINYVNAEPVIEAAFKSHGYHVTFPIGKPADIVHIAPASHSPTGAKADGPLHMSVSGGNGQIVFEPDPSGTELDVVMRLPSNELYGTGVHTTTLGTVDGYIDQKDYVHVFSDNASAAQQELNHDQLAVVGWKSTIATNGHGVVTDIDLSPTQSALDVLRLPAGYTVNVANIGTHGPNTGQLIITPPLGVGDGTPIEVDLPTNAFDGHGQLVNLNSPNIHQAIVDAATRDNVDLRFFSSNPNTAVVVDPAPPDNSIWARFTYGSSVIWDEYKGGITGAAIGTTVFGSLWQAMTRWSEGRNILTGKYDWKKNILERSRVQDSSSTSTQYIRRRRGLPKIRIKFSGSDKPGERVLVGTPDIPVPTLDSFRPLLQLGRSLFQRSSSRSRRRRQHQPITTTRPPNRDWSNVAAGSARVQPAPPLRVMSDQERNKLTTSR